MFHTHGHFQTILTVNSLLKHKNAFDILMLLQFLPNSTGLLCLNTFALVAPYDLVLVPPDFSGSFGHPYEKQNITRFVFF